MNRGVSIGLLIVAVLCGAAVLLLELRRRELVAALAARHSMAASAEAPGGNRRSSPAAPELTSNASADAAAVAGDRSPASLSATVAAARAEVVALEQRAERRHEEILAEARRRMTAATHLDPNNHDPERGLVKLDEVADQGRATPAAALQTLIWAAWHGQETAVQSGLALNGRARIRAELLAADVPRAAGEPITPEKLAALWFESTVVEAEGAYIAQQTLDGSDRATLLVYGGVGGGHTVTMQRTDAGWQLVVPERGLEAIQKKVLGSSPPIPP